MNYYIEGVTRPEYSAFIKGLSGRTSKILKNRKEVPQEIRALWGEVKAPQQNYIKTFEKLSTIKAENDFLEELARDLIGKGVASTDKSLVNNISLGDIAEGRLGKILGRGKVDKGMVRNPLENVYIDETYARAIKEGLDEITPTSGWAKGFMLAKGVTQTMKTVYSPATHGRNLIGNIFMLGANGLVPGYNSGKKAITQTAAKLAGMIPIGILTQYSGEELKAAGSQLVFPTVLEAYQYLKTFVIDKEEG